jgi:hypothetical protein
MIGQIPQLDGETGARARSACASLHLEKITGIGFKNRKLVSFLSDRVKHSG